LGAQLKTNHRYQNSVLCARMAVPSPDGYPKWLVMPGLVPGIHVFLAAPRVKTWMAGTSPAMTVHMR
jgi:hypothetical protein